MTELFIDGLPVVLTAGQSIKLTSENIYFTKSASYTYDIELPLDVDANRRIFGLINRVDKSVVGRTWPAKMVVDNVTVLSGSATLRSVSDKSVKVQLLGGSAAYNYGMDSLYIDELDLGDWYWETWPDGSCYSSSRGRKKTQSWTNYNPDKRIAASGLVLARARYKGPDFGNAQWTDDELMAKLISGEFGWVAFPTFNKEAEIRTNAIFWKETSPGGQCSPYFRGFEGEPGRHAPEDAEPVVSAFSIQPFVWKIVEAVAKGTGMTLSKLDNAIYQDIFLRKIFIVSTSSSALISKCLPHWTVNEFWTQIENTFGVVVSVDYADGRMRIEKRAQHYTNADAVTLSQIVDEFTAEVDDSTNKDISVNNVGFESFEAGPEDLLSDTVKNCAEHMYFDDYQSLTAWGAENSSTLINYKDVIFHADDREYIYSSKLGAFAEVNMFRPRMANDHEDDVEISLKIVPARYSTQLADIFPYHPSVAPGANDTYREIPMSTFDVRMLQVPGNAVAELEREGEYMDIESIIDDEEDFTIESKGSEQDLIYIAIGYERWDYYYVNGQTMRYPRASLRERCIAHFNGSRSVEDSGASLSLIPIPDQINLASVTVDSNNVKIETRTKRIIKFVADKIPAPGSIFIIRNKRFVCEKIEANVSEKGLDKLMTGYFYDFDMS